MARITTFYLAVDISILDIIADTWEEVVVVVEIITNKEMVATGPVQWDTQGLGTTSTDRMERSLALLTINLNINTNITTDHSTPGFQEEVSPEMLVSNLILTCHSYPALAEPLGRELRRM